MNLFNKLAATKVPKVRPTRWTERRVSRCSRPHEAPHAGLPSSRCDGGVRQLRPRQRRVGRLRPGDHRASTPHSAHTHAMPLSRIEMSWHRGAQGWALSGTRSLTADPCLHRRTCGAYHRGMALCGTHLTAATPCAQGTGQSRGYGATYHAGSIYIAAQAYAFCLCPLSLPWSCWLVCMSLTRLSLTRA